MRLKCINFGKESLKNLVFVSKVFLNRKSIKFVAQKIQNSEKSIMALAESQCYTIINTPEVSDIYNEMKIKKDLGRNLRKIIIFLSNLIISFKNRYIHQILCSRSISNETEKGDEKVQIDTLKKVIKLLLNGERLPGLLMTIIRFVMPSPNHTIKKLLLIFWEIVPKTTPDGKILQEMILVCDAYRKVRIKKNFIRL